MFTPQGSQVQSLPRPPRKGFQLKWLEAFFLYGEHVLVHHDDSALLRAIAEHRFAAVQLEPADTPDSQSRKLAPLPTTFERYYRPVFIDEDGRRLLVPIGR